MSYDCESYAIHHKMKQFPSYFAQRMSQRQEKTFGKEKGYKAMATAVDHFSRNITYASYTTYYDSDSHKCIYKPVHKNRSVK